MTLASEAEKLNPGIKTHTIRYDVPDRTLPDGITVTAGPDEEAEDEGGLVWNDDGSVTVNDAPPKKVSGKKNFNANLAIGMDESDLDVIASELLEAIEDDIRSRKDWEETFNRGIDLLGLKIETPTSEVTGGGNISKVKDPLLLEAVLRYQSNFNAEMLPADGPVKVRDDKVEGPPAPPPNMQSGMMGHNGGPPIEDAGDIDTAPAGMADGGVAMPMQQPMMPPMGGMPGAQQPQRPPMGGAAPPPPPSMPAGSPMTRADLAEAFEKDMNHYLTVTDKAYYPDTDRMSFSQALGGCAFKKVYRDPIENRPVSRFVMASHLIVSNGASSLHDAKRITHEIPTMTPITMKQMMEVGAYRDIELSQPISQPGTVDAKIAEVEGRQPRTDRPDDADYTVREVYCYRNLKGFEDKKKIPRPYRITVEKDSRKVLEIRRNWKEGDKTFKPRRRFVKYPLFPGLGFYDYGFVHILGNTTRVLSAIESLMVDQGMFANFPGGLIAKGAARQETNQIRPGPGGFKPIDTGGLPINQVVMPMPYKDVSANLMALAKGIQDGGKALASISELPLGEGRADVPVGTVIALIEQNQKLLSAVHKRNHSAQQEEFELLKELFSEDPESLSRLAKNPAREWETAEEFEDLNLIPASDPNTSSHIMRIMKAQAVLTIMQQAPPGLMNVKEGITRAFRAIGEEDIDALFLPPPPPGSQPPAPHQLDAQAKQMQIAAKAKTDAQNNSVKIQLQQMEMQDKAQDRVSAEKIEQGRLEQQAMKDAQEFQQGITPPGAPSVPPANGMGSF